MEHPQGQPAPKAGQGTDTPEGSQDKPDLSKFVNADQVAEIVNKAISSRNAAFEKKLTGLLEERDTALTGKLTEALSGALDERLKALAPAEPEKGDKKGEKGKKEAETSPEFKALQEQLAKQGADFEKLRKEAEANAKQASEERRKARDGALRQTTLDELAKHNLTGTRATLALAGLKERVGYADDKSDELVFRKGDEVVSLADGLKGWLDTEEARVLLPPRGTQGSGDGPSPRNQPGNQNNPVRALGEGLMAHWAVGNQRPG